MEKYRDYSFNFFKFIAVIIIVFFHCGAYTTFNSKIPFPFKNGNMWVNFFFMASGLLLTLKYYEKKIIKSEFYVQKIFKLYPLFIISLIPFIYYKSFIKNDLFANIFLIKAWFFFHALSLNGPTWFLSAYIFFILVFPLLLLVLKKSRYIFIGIIFFIFTNIYYIYKLMYPVIENKLIINRFILYFPISKITTFMLGMFLGYLILKYKLSKKYTKFFSNYIIIYFIFIIFNKKIFLLSDYSMINEYIYFNIVFIPLLLLLSQDTGYLHKIFQKNIFKIFGDISFVIYIIHIPWLIMYSKYFEALNIWGTINENFKFFIYFFILIFIVSPLFLLINNLIYKKIFYFYKKLIKC